jgi:hypothetical protein
MSVPISANDLVQGVLALYAHLDDYPFREETKLWAASAFAPMEAQSRRVLPLEQSQGALIALRGAAANLTALVASLNFSAPFGEADQERFVECCSTIDETRLCFNGHETLKGEASEALKDLMSAIREKVCDDMLAAQEVHSAGAGAPVGGTDWNAAKSDLTFLDVLKTRINDWEPESLEEFDGDDAVYLMNQLGQKHLINHTD